MTETASFPPVQAPLADPARTVFFGIPLRARATAIDWSKTCRDFSRTLASIYNQSNPNFRIIVCCHDIPDLLVPTDQRLEFIKVHTPAPDLRADPKSIFPDKSRKMRKAIERFHALGGGWLMILDADDLVSSRLVEFVSRSDNENGFLVREGYLLDQDSRACARIPNEHVFDHPFDQICGSCAVLKSDGSPESIDRIKRYFSSDHRRYARLSEEDKRPLASIPFPAVTYVVNTGDNHSFIFGAHRLSRNSTLLPRLRTHAQPINSNTAREFSLDRPLWEVIQLDRARQAANDPAHPNFRAAFVGCGGMKCGSTALAEYLALHPSIGMGEKKELRFFNHEPHFRSPSPDYGRYHARFARRPGAALYGEVTPLYIYQPQALMRIRNYNPATKVLCIFRNPVDRAYSHWAMEVREGREHLEFSKAIRAEPERHRSQQAWQAIYFSYVDFGFYSEQVRRLWRIFGENQVLFLRNEELREDPEATMKNVFRFLGLEPITISHRIDTRVGKYSDRPSLADRNYMLHKFEFDIRALERMLNWDCSAWLR